MSNSNPGAHREPRAVYEDRLSARRQSVASLDRADGRIANLRLVLFLVALAMAWLAWGRHLFSSWWLLVPVAAFGVVAVVHDRLHDRRSLMLRAVAFYELGLARVEGRWAGLGNDGSRFDDPAHPYARDLDVFGKGSLFERLCVARTAAGEETLARWLLAPAPAASVRERQAAGRELAPKVDLREDLALLGSDVRATLEPERLVAWGTAPQVLPGPAVRWVAVVLSVCGVAAGVGWALGIGPLPFAAVLLLDIVFLRLLRERLALATAGIHKAGADLSILAGVLSRFESEEVRAPLLIELKDALGGRGVPASRHIEKLARASELLEAQANQFFTPIAVVLLWQVHLAWRIEGWRREHGPAIARWLEVVGELEALCSLATWAFENPEDPWPDVVDEGPLFEGSALAHPLLPGAVANDVSLGGTLRALVVSGSNMSGKSTLLRTVGANAVLALAGGKVRARSLRLSSLAIGGTLRVQDSLQEGASRFYAEIKRLRQLVEIADGPLPLLFLVDEILHGTNSHDRKIGAEAVLREFLEKGAIGLLTTHDLALAQAAEALAPRAANVHFEDHMEEGRLAFDYKMRPGVVRKSNALELMRAVGLAV